MEMGPGEQRGQSGGDVPRVRLREQPQSQAGRRWGWGQARSPHGETLCPQRENKGPNPLFPNHCWEVPVPPLMGTADQEKALAGFNLVWALGAYQVILFPPRRVLLLPALDPPSSTWSVHT